MRPIIQVENLSKQYRLGARRAASATFRDALADAARSPLKRLRRQRDSAGDLIWALRGVSFEVMPGEVVGIIGRNGAGKSTLLKILSRITEPTDGRIKIYGRVGSLLEVGTGFHPELTGRENIYLNGAILGMRRREINDKFDEIVAFAELERFLDTPVKRYSSGMYTRLAFAVAANLEPEILVVDEVLSVGDAAFQQKCLGKMHDVATHGRTVLFVSHQLSAVVQLCTKALLLNRGQIVKEGETQQVIDYYLSEVSPSDADGFRGDDDAGKDIAIVRARAVDSLGETKSNFTHKEQIEVAITCKINKWVPNSVMGFFVRDHRGRKVFTTKNPRWGEAGRGGEEVEVTATIPGAFLVPGKYAFTLSVSVPNERVIDYVEDVLPITIVDGGSEFSLYEGGDYGCVFANCEWR